MLSFSSIVLLGHFNPAIFHPEWLDRYKILPVQEIQWAEGEKPKRTEAQHKSKYSVNPSPMKVTSRFYDEIVKIDFEAFA